MGKHYVILSFFKEQQIDYYFNSDNMTITFPCPYCWEQTEMKALTSEWKCSSCFELGNLLTLMIATKEEPIRAKVNVFDPEKERKSIQEILERLAKKGSYSKSILVLQEKVNRLIDYYEQHS